MAEGEKKPLIHWIFFWVSGIGCLLVWNSVLSLTYYLEQRYDPEAEKYYPFTFIFGGFCCFFVYSYIDKWLGFKRIITTIPMVQAFLFLVLFLIGELVQTHEQGIEKNFKLWILMGMTCIIGFNNNIMQTALIGNTFKFSHVEISYYNSGNAISGVLTTLIAFVCAMTLDQQDLFINGLLYVIFVAVSLTIVLLVHSRYIAVCYQEDPSSKPKSNRPSAQRDGNAQRNSEEKSKQVSLKPSVTPQQQVSKWTTFKLIYNLMGQMMFIYVVTLSLFPALSLKLGIGWDSPAAIQIVLLVYNFGDFLGKYFYSFVVVKKPWITELLISARVVFSIYIILVLGDLNILDDLKGKWYASVPFFILLAISNGYLTSALFSHSSEAVPDNQKGNSGFLMTLSLLFGLCYGSFTVSLET